MFITAWHSAIYCRGILIQPNLYIIFKLGCKLKGFNKGDEFFHSMCCVDNEQTKKVIIGLCYCFLQTINKASKNKNK